MAAKIMEDCREFDWIVGSMDMYDLAKRGIMSSTMLGGFYSYELDKVYAACSRYDDLHIVSVIDINRVVNRYEPNSQLYHLCDGDKDPDLELVMKMPTLAEIRESLEIRLAKPESQRGFVDHFMISWYSGIVDSQKIFDADFIRSGVAKKVS